MATDKPHFSITVDHDTFKFIVEFQHKNRYPNRNMAINALLLAGAEALKDQEDTSIKVATRKKRKQDTA